MRWLSAIVSSFRRPLKSDPPPAAPAPPRPVRPVVPPPRPDNINGEVEAVKASGVRLNVLDPRVPADHEEWSDEDYAGRIVVILGRAGSRYLEGNGDGAAPPELQRYLVEALVLTIEWAHRRGWPLSADFGLRLGWQRHGFLYLVLRAGEALSAAHWAAVNSNPSRAMEQVNFAIGCLVDYARWRAWPVEEEAERIIREEVD